jgi:hypothetical protein
MHDKITTLSQTRVLDYNGEKNDGPASGGWRASLSQTPKDKTRHKLNRRNQIVKTTATAPRV